MSALANVAAVLVIVNAAMIAVAARALARLRRTQTVLDALVRRERRWVWLRPDDSPVDPTAQTCPLTDGQRIVAAWERDGIAEPCELAEAIDRALWHARNPERTP